MTVGELMSALKDFDPETPVKVEVHVEALTEAGTDLGGEEERDIDGIKDLESRVILTTY